MKILLIGACPPPHGGISVHMTRIERDLPAAGIECAVLNTGAVGSWPGFCLTLLRYAARGWTFHLHTNGHNRNSWLIVLACGLIARSCILTLHSGMAPAYLRAASASRRRLARFASQRYARIIAVNTAIHDALAALDVPLDRLEVIPAYLGVERSGIAHTAPVLKWMRDRSPVLSTALFYRPEYGFDLLAEALQRLCDKHPALGCVVMGDGEDRAEAERLIRSSHLENNILLSGDVDHDLCLAVMAGSDVFLRTTREDGDSISVREALSLGVPVVASRVGARPEGAVLFRPGSVDELTARIEEALAHPGKAPAATPGCQGWKALNESWDRLISVYYAAA